MTGGPIRHMSSGHCHYLEAFADMYRDVAHAVRGDASAMPCYASLAGTVAGLHFSRAAQDGRGSISTDLGDDT